MALSYNTGEVISDTLERELPSVARAHAGKYVSRGCWCRRGALPVAACYALLTSTFPIQQSVRSSR